MFCLVFNLTSYADDAFRLDEVRLSEGTSNLGVNCIIQDAIGFMWFGADSGLYKYDGRELTIYRHNPDDPDSPSNNTILLFRQGSDGHIWMATGAGLVDRFDPTSGIYSHFQIRSLDGTITNYPIKDLAIGPQGRAFAVTFWGGLAILDQEEGEFQELNLTISDGSNSSVSIQQVMFDKNGYLWANLDSRRPALLNIRNESAEIQLESENYGIGRAASRHILMFSGGDGSLWIRTGQGSFYLLDEDSRTFARAASGNAPVTDGDYEAITSVLEDSDGNFWHSAVAPGGVIISTTSGVKVSLIQSAGSTPFLFLQRQDIVRSLYLDRSDTVWIGTNQGMHKYSKYRRKFNSFIPGDRAGVVSTNNISCIYEDSPGSIWLGTMGGGFIHIMKELQAYAVFDLKLGFPDCANSVQSILRGDDEDTLLLGTVDLGLVSFNTKTYQYRQLTDPMQVFDIHRDSAGVLRIATFVNGLGEYDDAGNLTFWDPIEATSTQTDTFDVRVIFEDSGNSLWVGTEGKGVFRIAPDRQTYVQFRHSADPASLSDDNVLDITQDDKGAIWIATRNGLSRFDESSLRFQRYDKSTGLPDNIICGVLADRDNLWLSTYSGLAQLNLPDGSVTTYDVFDGLQDNLFNPGAVCISSDGTYYFGGINGFNGFRPEELTKNPHVPPVVITRVDVPGVTEQINPLSTADISLNLPYSESLFIADFAALDYVDPTNNTYAYIMEGLDEDWIHVGNSQQAIYSKLPPGKYQFRVRAANSDGVWSDAKPISIFVSSPFWMTIQFYVIIAVLALSLIVLVFQVRQRALMKQRNQLQREVDERTIAQAQLLANQHRLREMAAELTLAEERERRRIASALHDDIGHSLVTSKVRLKSQLKMQVDDDARQNIEKVLESIDSALQRSRSLTVDISPPSLYQFGFQAAAEGLLERFSEDLNLKSVITVDKSITLSEENSVLLYQSMKELLVNVMKHSGADEVRVMISEEGDNVVLSVRDNGSGFDEERLNDDSQEARSFGLFSIRERMESVGGSFRLKTGDQEGTEVILSIPRGVRRE